MEESKDVSKIAPHTAKCIMENDRVRVLEIRMKPGDNVAMHSHPDHVIYILGGQKIKFTLSDGQEKEQELRAGQALWFEAGSHAVENNSKIETHVIAIELKK